MVFAIILLLSFCFMVSSTHDSQTQHMNIATKASSRGVGYKSFAFAQVLRDYWRICNTGMGCHFLLQCMKVKDESEVIQSCPTLSDPMD